jgi:membrane-bound ClpP family serine protease
MSGKADSVSADVDGSDVSAARAAIADEASSVEAGAKSEQASAITWPVFLRSAKDQDIKVRFAGELAEILASGGMDKYCVVLLLEPDNFIDSTDLDHVFSALSESNPDRQKDVLLILLSRGGSIEPAYQISKLCKSFAAERFVVAVPRHAKSAATLIAIGADEIHMGPLGQLGPIDPQLGGLPALGVSQALRTMASVAQQFPGSAEMFAKYLRMVLTVEQIGYCDRISESAVQYAERLLSTKLNLPKTAEAVAKDLVHEYKDHGFVIDIEEARMHLGSAWIKSGTAEVAAAEQIYTQFDLLNFLLGFTRSKRLIVVGGVSQPNSMMILNNKRD